MGILGLTSIIIPSRNEKYLTQTIQSLLKNAGETIEIIVVLDGYWCEAHEIVDDKRVIYIHFSEPRGMRNAINRGVDLAQGEFILKTDAHCLFAKGYDVELKKSCDDTMVVVPRRYALDVTTWDREVRTDKKYPIDYMVLDKNLHGEVWTEKNAVTGSLPQIDDLMTSQGSAWFMKKQYFYNLELLDERTYGTFWSEFQEIGLKAWLSGGSVKVNKNTWYAHWHKTEGRGYSLKEGKEKAEEAVKRFATKGWHKQKHDLIWLFNKFGYTWTQQ